MTVLVKSFLFTLMFSIAFYLTYNQVFNGYPSDILSHVRLVNQFSDGELSVAYPMWHLLVYGVAITFGLQLKQSAVIVTSLIIVALSLVVYKVIKTFLKDEFAGVSESHKEYLFLSMTVVAMVSTAVYVPFFNEKLYIGQASAGVWHNVTLIMVKPFAFLTLVFTAIFFEKRSLRWAALALSMALLSILAKPNFIIAFLPALFIFFIYFVIRKTGLSIFQVFYKIIDILKLFKKEIIFLLSLSVLSVLVLLLQFSVVYTSTASSQVVFDVFGVWSLYTNNVAGSLLLTYLFPVAVLFLVKNKNNDSYTLALIMTLVSVFLFAFFAEEGLRYKHGNFGWSQQISVHILFTLSLIEFARKYTQMSNWRNTILSITLSLHFISGVFYLIKVSKGLYYG